MKKAFVKVKEQKERIGILSFLEDNGYMLDSAEPRSKETIIDSILPITVDPADKTYSMMGNVTVAAAAASGGALITKEELFKQFMDAEIVNPKEEEEEES